MIADLQITLSRLASIELQQKFCIGATADTYLLPEELLDSALSSAETEIASGRLSALEVTSVQNFLVCGNASAEELNQMFGRGEAGMELVLASPAWIKARVAAATCLAELGLKLRVEV